MSELVCITGSSGVGKSTLSKFLYFIFGCKNVLELYGDDSHKWPRGNENWEKYTHLNPLSNNLDKEVEDLKSLLSGNKIKRKRYNHDTGQFDSSIEICPEEVIVYEGLHALHESIGDLCDIGIFVETENSLLTQWKIERDTQKRGYTIQQVKDAIKRRENDQTLYIEPQKQKADIIIRFEEKKDKKVHLEYECVTGVGENLAKNIKNIYDRHRDFLTLCEMISLEYDLVQHQGGNISYKFEDKMVITSSGKNMSDVTLLDGFSLCDDSGNLLDYTQDRPSMEAGLHLKIPHTFVLHTHPIHLNTILCSKESEKIIAQILMDYEYTYTPYFTPGEDLKNNFKVDPENNICLLESHGLICSGDSSKEVFRTSMEINELCKSWLLKNSKNFKKFSNVENVGGFLFPDSVVLHERMSPINDYMISLHEEVGLNSNFLSEKEIHKLLDMEQEQYRKLLL